MSLYVDYIYSSEDDSGSSFPGGSHIYTIWLIMQHGVNPGNIPMNLRLHLMMLP